MSSAAFTDFAPPTERLRLRSAALELELWPALGGSIAAFAWHAADGRRIPLFRDAGLRERYTPVDHLSSWPLLPYSNRIRAGSFRHRGRQHQLPVNYAGFEHPLHGVGWLSDWRPLASNGQQCTLELVHRGNEHWPYDFNAQQELVLQDLTLHSTLSLRNDSSSAMPCGLGQHPFICCPSGTRIKAQVSGVWLSDDEVLPREYQPLPPQWNLPAGCLLDGVFVDNCFDGLVGAIEVQWLDGSVLILESSANLRFVVVYHPLAGDFVCIEPVSHMPNAFNQAASADATGNSTLEPGATLCVTHRYTYRPA